MRVRAGIHNRYDHFVWLRIGRRVLYVGIFSHWLNGQLQDFTPGWGMFTDSVKIEKSPIFFHRP